MEAVFYHLVNDPILSSSLGWRTTKILLCMMVIPVQAIWLASPHSA